MKQMPSSFKQISETSGGAATLTPSAVSTSALPERLVAARLPCLATGRLAPALTKAAAGETLKVFAALEPVPAVSTKRSCRALMRTARPRIEEASPASSSTVSPFTASATRAAPICASVAVPSSSASNSAAASSRRRSSPRISRSVNSRRGGPARSPLRAGVGRSHCGSVLSLRGLSGMGRLELQKVGQQALALGGEDGLGVELHALDLEAAVAQTHDDAVGRRGRDFEAVGQTLALDDERVVARRGEAVFESLEDRPAVVANLGRLAVDGLGAAHDAPAEDLPDGLVAQAHAEHRHVTGERADHLQRHARLVRRPRPRRDDDAVGPYLLLDLPDRHLVVATHLHLRPQLAEVLHEVVGERVVVVYQQNLLAHRDTPPTVQAFRFAASASRRAFCTSGWRASDA